MWPVNNETMNRLAHYHHGNKRDVLNEGGEKISLLFIERSWFVSCTQVFIPGIEITRLMIVWFYTCINDYD